VEKSHISTVSEFVLDSRGSREIRRREIMMEIISGD
jgi:hypothetical protein